VGIVCDLREEGWHSMDLIADMLLAALPAAAAGEVQATRLGPTMARRATRLPIVGAGDRARLADRLASRLWDYPRWLALRARDFDVFHIVDHSYAHLVRALPAERVVVTCHDLDAVQPAVAGEFRLQPGWWLAQHVLAGLTRAAHVACVSHATRAELIATGRVAPDRVSVVYEGVHPSCTPGSTAPGGAPRRDPEILHVGSTIPRKRIDVLLEVFAGVREHFPRARLIRVGGAMSPAHRALAQRLRIADAVEEVPFLDRDDLTTRYRRASLVVLPSDREGFGLPVAEAMACGTPVVASAIPALQEVGGDAAIYCPPRDVPAWVEAVAALLSEEQEDPQRRAARRLRSIENAARFKWCTCAAEMAKLYQMVGAVAC
jgi:glycosyltransferase involved in cell wall biosynthesis